ncbi:hypothetical protein [Stenotrophomonas maltophilia]|uniref:hypothetical protein n=1 Tax=Stenotrophomonas maltophilia TaxID=40324 RepID=UPI0016609E67|nr:hypothetical protein [Stenotrophomonas maltophilia]
MDNFFDQFDQPEQPAAPKLARGQLQAGNIDLNNRPVVRNPDGSISTVRSISANFDGQEVLIPTVSEDGRVLSDDDAIAQYQRTGRNLGIFDTPDNATAYAQSLHRDQEQQYVPQADGGNFFDQFDGGAAPATLGDSPLRHADGRLTEAGWQAERDALAAARQKEVDNTGFWDNFVAGYGRSLPNLAQGAKQAYIDSVAGLTQGAADVLGDFGGHTLGDARRSAAGYFGDLSRDLRQETNQERIASQALIDSWGGKAGGLIGDAVNTAPLLPVGVAARGAGVAKAVGQAALGGSLQGAVQPVAKEGERLENTVLGGVLGGGLSALGRGAMTLGENVMPQNVTARALNFFNERANAKPFAAEGEALAQRTGINLTPAMVSGSKSQTAVENMARQSVFSADTAFQADEKIANQAIANVNRIMDRITPNSASAQTIGNRVQETVDKAVGSVFDRREKMAKEQFGAIRRMVGDTPVVDFAKTKQLLRDIISENDVPAASGDVNKIRAQAQRMLNELEAQPAYPLDAARKARTSYGSAWAGKSNLLRNVAPDMNRTFGKRMWGAVSEDIDAAATRIDEAAGFGRNMPVPEGVTVQRPSDLLRAANEEYRNHSDLLKRLQQSPMRRLLGDKVDVDGFTSYSLPPETVIQRINSMKPSELAQVRYFMERNEPEVWGQYKRMIVEDALGAAQTAPASAGANHVPFNAGGFIRAIGGDNPQKTERLQQIFNPNEMAEIRDAMEAARRMGDSFGKNFSGTGPYNEVMQASNGFIDAFKNASVRAAAGTAAPIAGFNKVARMMVDSNGRKALIELSRLPPGSRRANDLAAYLAATATVGSDEPLDIEIVGGKREGEPPAQ